jgi:hypothetical protein
MMSIVLGTTAEANLSPLFVRLQVQIEIYSTFIEVSGVWIPKATRSAPR